MDIQTTSNKRYTAAIKGVENTMKRHKISQEELAKLIGKKQSQISAWLSFKRMPSAHTLVLVMTGVNRLIEHKMSKLVSDDKQKSLFN